MSHQYATVEDMARFAVPAVVLRDIEDAEINAVLVSATSTADSYLENRYNPPITTVPDSLKEAVANLAAWTLIKQKGIRPGSEDEETIRESYEDAMKWLRDIAAGRATLPSQETAPGPSALPAFASNDERGWNNGDGTFGSGGSRDPEDPCSIC